MSCRQHSTVPGMVGFNSISDQFPFIFTSCRSPRLCDSSCSLLNVGWIILHVGGGGIFTLFHVDKGSDPKIVSQWGDLGGK